jgi:hypothetical protein
MEIDIEIDGLTNCLVKRVTGEECDTQYRLISKTITKAESESGSGLAFGEEFQDSRLTEQSDGKIFRLREAILLSKKLGRPLTKEEMENFIL